MALKPNDQVTPAFEDDATDIAASVIETPTEAPQASATAHQAAAPAPQVAPTTAVAIATMSDPFTALLNNFAKQGIEVEFGTFPRFKVDAGAITDGETNLGKYVDIEVQNFGYEWVISPSKQVSDSSKKLVKYSLDGITTKDGHNIQAYLEELRADGYSEADVSKRGVMHGLLLGAEEGVPESLDCALIELSLANTAVKAFDAFRLQQRALARKGRAAAVKEDGTVALRATAVRKKFGTNAFFTLEFKAI